MKDLKNMNDIRFYYCQNCAVSQPNLKASTGRVCLRYNTEVSDTDFCSKRVKNNNAQTCGLCGKLILGKSFIVDSNVICSNCINQLDKCNTCKHRNECSFETDPSSIPKEVQRTVRQGMMTMMTTVKNPERIKITCQNGCPCYQEATGVCGKSSGTCALYQSLLQ